jgi:TonB-linked SusC/RagA family outer membrane protein
MKKINNFFSWVYYLPWVRTSRIMKVLLFLLTISLVSFASGSYSQTRSFTFQLKGATLLDVFNQIEEQSDMQIAYDISSVDIKHRLNLEANSESIDNVLKRALEDTDLSYRIMSRYIIITKKDNANRVSAALQQPLKVTGKVTDSSGAPLPGAAVTIKGTTRGITTDTNGNYVLSGLSREDVLVFSFIGMTSKEVEIGSQNEINIRLDADAIGINEVVVTALGIERDRKSLGYAISTIKANELTVAGNTQNPILSLYGKAAGVTIRQSTSGPLGGININIRGAAGLQSDANTRPLFVIDGVPIFDENTGLDKSSIDYGTGINDINPDDIESIDILKGAKASVLYGSEGANGVVLIKTKSGGKIPDRLNVNVSIQTAIEQPLTYIDFQNKYGSGATIYDVKTLVEGEDYPRFNSNSRNFGPAFNANEKRIWWDGVARPYVAHPDNYDFLFSNGSNKQVNVAVDKSGSFGNVRLSFTNMKYKGVMDNLGQDKNTISFSGTFKLSNKFSVETVTNLYTVKSKNRPTNTLSFFVNGISRDAPFEEFVRNGDYLYSDPTDPNFGYKKDFEEAAYPTGYYSLKNYADYAWSRNHNNYYDDKFHLIATIKPTYRITDWLSVAGQFSLDYTDTDYTTKVGVTRVDPELVGGSYAYSRRNTKIQEYKGMINFYKSVVDNHLDVSSFVGISYKNESENSIGVSTANYGTSSGFIYPDWFYLDNQNPAGWPTSNSMGSVRSNSYGENSLYGLFGVATLTWDKKYTLELNARNDWSSTLDPDNNSYFYPGVAFTWDATDVLQGFLPGLQFGNFRTSWADVGRDAPSRYYAYNSLSSGTITGTSATSVSTPSSLFAGVLKPERKREFEFGTEMSFFKGNRLRLDLSVYTNSVYDQIMSVPLSSSTGASEIKINAGKVKNWGYEVQVNGTPVIAGNFRWDLTFTTANQFSEVSRLYSGITKKTISGMRGNVNVMAREGERIGNIYGTALKLDPNGNRIVSTDGSAYVLDENNEVFIGNVFPNFMGGFNSTFSYKGFSLYTHLDYSFGASMYSETNEWLYYNGASKQSLKHRDAENGGLQYTSGDNTYYDGIILDGVQEVSGSSGVTYEKNTKIASVGSYYSTFVSWAGESINAVDLKYKNDYIKFREISLSYELPRRIAGSMKMHDVVLALFARNVGYLYKSVPNLDAEAYMGTSSYFEASPIPSARTLGLKLSVGL